MPARITVQADKWPVHVHNRLGGPNHNAEKETIAVGAMKEFTLGHGTELIINEMVGDHTGVAAQELRDPSDRRPYPSVETSLKAVPVKPEGPTPEQNLEDARKNAKDSRANDSKRS